MALFRPYQRTEAPAEEPATPASDSAKPAGKAAPTPTRREAEQARRERLNPTLTPKQARAKERQAKVAAREANMRSAESQPGKVLVRDWVDSRRGLAPFSMPILMLMLMLSLVTTGFGTLATALMSYATWIVLLLIAIDLFRMWHGYKKLHAARLPREPLKGLLGYAINRSINLRRLRLPAARVKPGDEI